MFNLDPLDRIHYREYCNCGNFVSTILECECCGMECCMSCAITCESCGNTVCIDCQSNLVPDICCFCEDNYVETIIDSTPPEEDEEESDKVVLVIKGKFYPVSDAQRSNQLMAGLIQLLKFQPRRYDYEEMSFRIKGLGYFKYTYSYRDPNQEAHCYLIYCEEAKDPYDLSLH